MLREILVAVHEQVDLPLALILKWMTAWSARVAPEPSVVVAMMLSVLRRREVRLRVGR